jgi:hypothetical protein
MRKRRITCVSKPAPENHVEAIKSVGGEDADGRPFEATRDHQVYDDIKNGQWGYVVWQEIHQDTARWRSSR